MEDKAAVDSGVVFCAKRNGTVERVTADDITIRAEDGTKDVYHLIKFKRSNQGTCVNQRPIVDVGELVNAGDVIADGPATSGGEISLGKNALIGFTPTLPLSEPVWSIRLPSTQALLSALSATV